MPPAHITSASDSPWGSLPSDVADQLGRDNYTNSPQSSNATPSAHPDIATSDVHHEHSAHDGPSGSVHSHAEPPPDPATNAAMLTRQAAEIAMHSILTAPLGSAYELASAPGSGPDPPSPDAGSSGSSQSMVHPTPLDHTPATAPTQPTIQAESNVQAVNVNLHANPVSTFHAEASGHVHPVSAVSDYSRARSAPSLADLDLLEQEQMQGVWTSIVNPVLDVSASGSWSAPQRKRGVGFGSEIDGGSALSAAADEAGAETELIGVAFGREAEEVAVGNASTETGTRVSAGELGSAGMLHGEGSCKHNSQAL